MSGFDWEQGLNVSARMELAVSQFFPTTVFFFLNDLHGHHRISTGLAHLRDNAMKCSLSTCQAKSWNEIESNHWVLFQVLTAREEKLEKKREFQEIVNQVISWVKQSVAWSQRGRGPWRLQVGLSFR